jgi:hypothetical protein
MQRAANTGTISPSAGLFNPMQRAANAYTSAPVGITPLEGVANKTTADGL